MANPHKIPIGFKDFRIVREILLDGCGDTGCAGFRDGDEICSNIEWCCTCVVQCQSIHNIVTMLVEKKCITKRQALELILDYREDD